MLLLLKRLQGRYLQHKTWIRGNNMYSSRTDEVTTCHVATHVTWLWFTRASITHCMKEQCCKRTMQRLPCCCHGAWHCVLYCYLMYDAPLSFSPPSVPLMSQTECEPPMYNVPSDTSPQMYTKGPARDDNYVIIIISVIRIWATHCPKESFNDGTESLIYLMTNTQASLDIKKNKKNTDVAPIISNHGQSYLSLTYISGSWCLG